MNIVQRFFLIIFKNYLSRINLKLMVQTRIESVTFKLLAQRFNQLN